MEELIKFITNYRTVFDLIITEYGKANSGVLPLINEDGLLVAPNDRYKLPNDKLIIGLPMSFAKSEVIPFLTIKNNRYSSLLSKVTNRDTNVFEKIKLSTNVANKIKRLFFDEKVLIEISTGKSWFENNEEFSYLYIKGSLSKKGKKDLSLIFSKMNKNSFSAKEKVDQPDVVKSKTKKEIKEKFELDGKIEVTSKLLDFEIQERKVLESKIEKRYVGIFKLEDGRKIQGTIPKKMLDELNFEIEKAIGKKVTFTANFKNNQQKSFYYYSNPIKFKFCD